MKGMKTRPLRSAFEGRLAAIDSQLGLKGGDTGGRVPGSPVKELVAGTMVDVASWTTLGLSPHRSPSDALSLRFHHTKSSYVSLIAYCWPQISIARN